MACLAILEACDDVSAACTRDEILQHLMWVFTGWLWTACSSCNSPPQRQDLSSLICQIINELSILPILPHQRLPQFKHRRVYADSSMALEDRCNGIEGHLPYGHLLWSQVPGALGSLGLPVGLIGLYQAAYVCQHRAYLVPKRIQCLLYSLHQCTNRTLPQEAATHCNGMTEIRRVGFVYHMARLTQQAFARLAPGSI